jgi:hypothetical protein
MKKKLSYSAAALLLASALILSGCNMITNLFGGDVITTTQKTLAEQVVDELVANLNTASKAVSSRAAAFTSTEINQIKTKALNKIATDGLKDSQYIDEIVPSMVLGVGDAVSVIAANDKDKQSTLLQVTAKSSVQSMAKSERSNNFKKDKKEAVADVAITVITVVQNNSSDTDVALAVSKEFSATVITSFSDTSDAMLTTVTNKVTSELSDSTVVGIVVQGTIASVVENTTDTSKQQALVQAAISGAMEAAQYSTNTADIAVAIINEQFSLSRNF